MKLVKLWVITKSKQKIEKQNIKALVVQGADVPRFVPPTKKRKEMDKLRYKNISSYSKVPYKREQINRFCCASAVLKLTQTRKQIDKKVLKRGRGSGDSKQIKATKNVMSHSPL